MIDPATEFETSSFSTAFWSPLGTAHRNADSRLEQEEATFMDRQLLFDFSFHYCFSLESHLHGYGMLGVFASIAADVTRCGLGRVCAKLFVFERSERALKKTLLRCDVTLLLKGTAAVRSKRSAARIIPSSRGVDKRKLIKNPRWRTVRTNPTFPCHSEVHQGLDLRGEVPVSSHGERKKIFFCQTHN